MSPNLMIWVIGAAAFGGAMLMLHAAIAGFSSYQRRFTTHARNRLEEAFVFIDPNKLFLVTILGTVVVPPVLWLLTGSAALAILVVVLAIAGPRISFRVINSRRRMKIIKQLPDVLLMLGSSLRAGTSLQIALDLAIRETPSPLSQVRVMPCLGGKASRERKSHASLRHRRDRCAGAAPCPWAGRSGS